MKVGFITMEKNENRKPNSVGSSRIRAKWVWKHWDEAEEYQIGEKYDVMIFQKAYWGSMLESFKGIKIFDICDPDWLDQRPVVKVMNLCDAVTTSTEALAKFLRKIFPGKIITCVHDRIDLTEHTLIKKHEGKAKSCVWFGYSGNAGALDRAIDHLIERNLSLTVISDKPYEPPRTIKPFKVVNLPYRYESIYRDLVANDIVLLPELLSLRGKFKSNNKTLTAWALGMPVAKIPEDLDEFSSPIAREREGTLRRKQIEAEWDVKFSVKDYKKLIVKIKNKG